MGNVVFRATLSFQPSLSTEELSTVFPVSELVSRDSLERHAEWSLTGDFCSAGAEGAALGVVYTVLRLAFCLGIANFLVMGGINTREPSLSWANFNTSTGMAVGTESVAAGTLEKCQGKRLANK